MKVLIRRDKEGEGEPVPVGLAKWVTRLMRFVSRRTREETWGQCYVYGTEDIFAWRGRNYIDHLLSVVGGMASFSYLKFKRATPPNMVFWGPSTKYFVPNLERIIGYSFSFSLE